MTRAHIEAIAVDRDYSVVFLSGWLGRLSPQADSIEYFDGDAVRDPRTGFPHLTHMALTPQGEIVAAGRVNPPILSTRIPFVIVRVNAQGALLTQATLRARDDDPEPPIETIIGAGYRLRSDLLQGPGTDA